METQVLYRKYRPQTFSDVSGQKVSIKILENSIKKNIFSHAYIFFGPRGTGKTSVAKIFAKAVNCESKKEKPCGECDKCLNSSMGEAVDIIEIDAASNNGIDDIREIRNKINLVPAVMKYKVYIIDEVHMLTTGAFNGLLKTLEEPPSHAIFILATTELNKVPQTILSRCQLIEFKKLSIRDINSRVREIAGLEKIKIDEKAIKEISKNANGGMRDALGVLDKAIAYSQEKTIELEDIKEITGNILDDDLDALYKNILKKEKEIVFEALDKYYEDGKDLVIISEALIYKMRDSLFDKEISQREKTNICSVIKTFNEVIEKMKSSNYQKVLLDVFLIEAMSQEENDELKSVDEQYIEAPTFEPLNTSTKTKEDATLEKTDSKVSKPKTTKKENIKKKIKVKELKEVRVNNCFVGANKNLKEDLNKNWFVLNDHVLDAKMGNDAKMLLTAEIAAVSEDHIILVLDYNGSAAEANSKIEEYEEVLKKALKKNYKVVFVSNKEWKDITKDFIKNKGKIYEHIEEDDIIYEQIENNSEIYDKFTELFGDKNVEIKGE